MLNWRRVLNLATTESTHVIFFSWFVLCLLIFFPLSCLRHVLGSCYARFLGLVTGLGGTKHVTWHVIFGEVISIKHGRLHATWHVMFGEVISVKHGRLRAKHVPPEYQEKCLNITR